MKFNYGGRAADEHKVYHVGNLGKMRRVDIFDDFWDEWKSANVVFIDFPYDDRMLKHYYEQIDQTTDKTFIDLKNKAFEIINEIAPERVFVEIGKRNLQAVVDALKNSGYKVRVHPCFYAKKNPCFIVEGCIDGIDFCAYNIANIDELDSIEQICKNEKGCICDFFNGQGAVSLSAYKNGLKFICSELNPNRLGKALTRLEKAGAVIT